MISVCNIVNSTWKYFRMSLVSITSTDTDSTFVSMAREYQPNKISILTNEFIGMYSYLDYAELSFGTFLK